MALKNKTEHSPRVCTEIIQKALLSYKAQVVSIALFSQSIVLKIIPNVGIMNKTHISTTSEGRNVSLVVWFQFEINYSQVLSVSQWPLSVGGRLKQLP